MDGLTIALWAVGGLVAVGSLVKIMLARRGQVMQEWQSKVASEKRKNKTE